MDDIGEVRAQIINAMEGLTALAALVNVFGEALRAALDRVESLQERVATLERQLAERN